MIRIAGGAFRGRRLRVPDGIRPTTEKVRKAAFDILGPAVEGSSVLDAAAGSGAYGLEALSRGAARVTFVEAHPRSRRALAANVEALGVSGRVSVIAARVDDWLRARSAGGGSFDVVFHDPPYAEAASGDVDGLLGVLNAGGVLFHETREGAPPPSTRGAPPVVRRYGSTQLLVYRGP